MDNKAVMVAATGVFLVAMYFFSWTGLIVVFVALVVAVTAYNLLWIRPRVQAANALLYEQGDPDAFLRAMDEILEGRILPARSASRTRDMLVVNRTAGLFFAGRWKEALAALDGIDAGALPAPFRHLHFVNALGCLIALEDLEAAERSVAFDPSLLEPLPRHPEYGVAVKGNLAALARLQGDRARSREMLEELRVELEGGAHPHPDLMLAVGHYQLGRLDLDEGRTEDARSHFVEAVRLAPKTYLPGAIESLLATP